MPEMTDLTELYEKLVENPNLAGPVIDMCRCSECGWEGFTTNLETVMEGEFETGYYPVPVCPQCPDEGCLDDWFPSMEVLREMNRQ